MSYFCSLTRASTAVNTTNELAIPTVFKRGQLDINIKGKTSLEIGYSGEQKKSR